MNRKIRKILAVVCAISMVVTSMTGLKLTSVVADTTTTVIKTGDATRAPLLAEIASSDYNFALGKEASVSMLTTGDGGTNIACITDGTFATANSPNTIIMVGKGSKENGWVQVDLGKAYDTSKIDRVAVQYKTNNSGPKSGYYISYSLNGIDFVTVATVAAIAGSNNQIYLDKISLTADQAAAIPYARYVRVTSTTDNSAYGLQVKGMAVLTDGTTKVSEVGFEEVEMLDDIASLTVTSSDFNQLEYSFEASPEDDGSYVYKVYINGIVYEESATPGQQYVETGLAAGDYVVKVVASSGELSSEGVTKSVAVNDTTSLLTSDRNLASGKTATPSSIRENDDPARITDGNLTNLFRTISNTEPANIVIDLGQNYRLDAIERTVGYYSTANRHPQNYTIDFSLNGTDFQTVAESSENTIVQSVVVDVSECTLPAVRYVRFSLYNPINGMGFQLYELGVIAKEGADLTPVEVATVDDPAAVEVTVPAYNTAEVTITAGEGQEDYKYNIYIDGAPVMLGVDAGTYTLEDVVAGDRVFTVKSAYEGVTSDGISVTKTIQNAIDYTYEWLAGSTAEAVKTIDETKTVEDVTFNNYAFFKKATASASSQENENLIPVNVLDGLNNTRWASEAADPQWIVIDLGGEYDVHMMDIIWQTASGRDFALEYSVDGDEYNKIGFVKNAVTGSRHDSIVFAENVTARYIRIYGTARTGVYGYSIWDLGIYGPDSEDTTPTDVAGLAVAAGVATWQQSVYATSYNVYCGGELVGTTSELTYDFSDLFASNGEYEVGVQAVGEDGKTSAITTITVQYDEEETTTEAPEVKFGWEIQYPDGNGFVPTDFEMPGFTIEGIPADTEKWVCGARLQNIPVEAGKTYTVSFTVVSSVNKVVPVEFTNGTGGYINVNATPEGAVYSQQFTAVGDTVKLYMPLGVDAAVDGTITEAYNITVSDVQVVEYVEGETTTEAPTEEPSSEEPSSEEPSSEEETTTEAPKVEIPKAPEGLTYAGNADLPFYFAWAPSEGATAYSVYVNGDYVTTVMVTNVNLDADLFAEAGEYTIAVKAINEAGESAASTTTYTVEPTIVEYEVSVDGTVVATVEEGATYTLGDAAMGYVCGDSAYKAGTEVTVNADMAFTTIELSVTAAQGAGIRYNMVDEDGNPLGGIRFQSKIDAVEAVLNSAAVKAGTLVTANDIYTELGNSELTLDSTYTYINIGNSGWYNGEVGTFCGSVVKIVESNWIRDFIARSYVTITYTDGTTETVYSNMTGVRSIKGVAQAVQNAGYAGVEDAYKATIDAFVAAK